MSHQKPHMVVETDFRFSPGKLVKKKKKKETQKTITIINFSGRKVRIHSC